MAPIYGSYPGQAKIEAMMNQKSQKEVGDGVNNMEIVAIRGRPYMTSVKFSGFLTPPPVRIWD